MQNLYHKLKWKCSISSLKIIWISIWFVFLVIPRHPTIDILQMKTRYSVYKHSTNASQLLRKCVIDNDKRGNLIILGMLNQLKTMMNSLDIIKSGWMNHKALLLFTVLWWWSTPVSCASPVMVRPLLTCGDGRERSHAASWPYSRKPRYHGRPV